MASALPVTHLLYLHGFRSSPLSTKARQVQARVCEQHPAVTWWCPQLPPSPRGAMKMLMEGLARWPHDRMAVMGSSLGGFYATCVAEAAGCRAVLLNPAVHPARDLAGQVGEHSGWQDPEQHFIFEARFLDEFRALEPGPIAKPGNYFAVIAKGDEVLDWHEMCGRYPGARIKLLDAGDHALTDFDAHLDDVFDFLGLVTES